MSSLKTLEYIWIDGQKPVSRMRSKTRVVELPDHPEVKHIPDWGFDGSSTVQAKQDDSDCLLRPVCVVSDPIRNGGDYLVLCEVFSPDQTEHPSNSRAKLRKILDKGGQKCQPWVGFEQEYTMFKKHNTPLGWPEWGFPEPQGPYYCGVGSRRIFGRDLALEHKKACLEAGLIYYGMNAEVMPGQWEFQMGYRGVNDEDPGALNVSDHLWLARWLLDRISEEYGIDISYENKPVKGDWNGAGMHTNFSTQSMRDPQSSPKVIHDVIERLRARHAHHIAVYGHKLEERLTGLHETSHIHQFSSGYAHRGSSIRIPRVSLKANTYIEDRRPGANSDPYLVAAVLVETICTIVDASQEHEHV